MSFPSNVSRFCCVANLHTERIARTYPATYDCSNRLLGSLTCYRCSQEPDEQPATDSSQNDASGQESAKTPSQTPGDNGRDNPPARSRRVRTENTRLHQTADHTACDRGEPEQPTLRKVARAEPELVNEHDRYEGDSHAYHRAQHPTTRQSDPSANRNHLEKAYGRARAKADYEIRLLRVHEIDHKIGEYYCPDESHDPSTSGRDQPSSPETPADV